MPLTEAVKRQRVEQAKERIVESVRHIDALGENARHDDWLYLHDCVRQLAELEKG